MEGHIYFPEVISDALAYSVTHLMLQTYKLKKSSALIVIYISNAKLIKCNWK